MNWLYPVFIIIGLLNEAVFVIALVSITAKIARNEPLKLREKKPPSPIYDTPEQRNKIREEIRQEQDIQWKEHG